ncbi:MAG: cytochrome d ubiquinol oxidase subunit II [Deltaproteobacteria bacterium]|nr:cytochrome d ubiquinol oxidase subunit II [Nannocystaceae bacterium]
MISAAMLLAWVIALALVAYVLTAGADFGAGLWDLLAIGPRAQRQRTAIEHAIAPIWEANHIWMILVVVLAFTGFPEAFALVCIALHIPISLALVGIVLRGAAFSFRSYGVRSEVARSRWGHVFAWASLITPVCLGLVIAGMSSGAIVQDGGVMRSGYFAGWTSAFAVLTGAFVLAIFALLAAVYLTLDVSDDAELQADFRRRALVCELVAGLLAATVAWRASVDAPLLLHGLLHGPWSIAVQLLTMLAALATIFALIRDRFVIARITVAAQIALVVLGWALAMDGHLVLDAIPIERAGARPGVIGPVLWVLAAGGLVLLPALWWLMRVFKQRASSADL